MIKKEVIHNGKKLIVVDPRKIELSKYADYYFQINPGTNVAILNGFMHVLIKEGLYNKDYVVSRCEGFEEMAKVLEKYTPEYVAEICGINNPDDIVGAARLMAQLKPMALYYSMGITQHTTGVDNVKSVANLQMLTGHLGKRGGGVNALRGQNNVQGACDMGALPNVYSGYQAVINPDFQKKMKDAWGVSEIAEGKVGYTVTEMVNVLADTPGKLKCLYIMGENPMISDPDLHHVEKGLKNAEFIVVQDIFLTETAQMANVVLPAACYAEKDGTQTSTERRVQKWRKAQNPPGEAKADWQIICELAKAMGFEKQFAFKSPEEVFNEVAKVTPSYGGMDYARLEKPEALHWPCPTKDHPGTPILHKEKFAHPDGLGVFTPIEFKYPAEVPDKDFPIILTTGRCIWHWHTGSMTRRSPSLEREEPTGWVEINTDDAKEWGIKDQEMVKAVTRRGEIRIKARVTKGIKRNEVFIPFHFVECAANVLTNNALDPTAKIPEFKACALRIEKIKEA